MSNHIIPNKDIIIFADGACSGNPGPGGWAYVLIAPDTKKGHLVSEFGGFDPDTTNNKMELTAVGKALRTLEDAADESKAAVKIYTDSTYVIKGITLWMKNWEANGWKKQDGESISNETFWKRLFEMMQNRQINKSAKIHFKHVAGHSGFVLNERCDEIAVSFCKKTEIDLFHGTLQEYEKKLAFSLEDEIKKIAEFETTSATTSSKKTTYLSFVDNKLEEHASWSECEARVKGKSGAKFKKCKNPQEVLLTKKSWGL